jgi:hypothetical protein
MHIRWRIWQAVCVCRDVALIFSNHLGEAIPVDSVQEFIDSIHKKETQDEALVCSGRGRDLWSAKIQRWPLNGLGTAGMA